MPPRIDDAVTILTQKVAALSKEVQELRPYRAIADVEAEIAAKKAAFAQKVRQLKQAAATIQEERDKLALERAAIEADRAAAAEEKEKTTALARALMARVADHADRIRREAGEAIFREYERIGDERYALQQEIRRFRLQAKAEPTESSGTTEAAVPDTPDAPEPAEPVAIDAPEIAEAPETNETASAESAKSAENSPEPEETPEVAESRDEVVEDTAESDDEADEDAAAESPEEEPTGPKMRLVRPTKKRRRWR